MASGTYRVGVRSGSKVIAITSPDSSSLSGLQIDGVTYDIEVGSVEGETFTMTDQVSDSIEAIELKTIQIGDDIWKIGGGDTEQIENSIHILQDRYTDLLNKYDRLIAIIDGETIIVYAYDDISGEYIELFAYDDNGVLQRLEYTED